MFSRLRSFLTAWTRRERFGDSLDEEVWFHLDAYAEDLVHSGVPRREALPAHGVHRRSLRPRVGDGWRPSVCGMESARRAAGGADCGRCPVADRRSASAPWTSPTCGDDPDAALRRRGCDERLRGRGGPGDCARGRALRHPSRRPRVFFGRARVPADGRGRSRLRCCAPGHPHPSRRRASRQLTTAESWSSAPRSLSDTGWAARSGA